MPLSAGLPTRPVLHVFLPRSVLCGTQDPPGLLSLEGSSVCTRVCFTSFTVGALPPGCRTAEEGTSRYKSKVLIFFVREPFL